MAKKLGNTPSICRKCYIHPALLESYLKGTMVEVLKKEIKKKVKGLEVEEVALLNFLQNYLKPPKQNL